MTCHHIGRDITMTRGDVTISNITPNTPDPKFAGGTIVIIKPVLNVGL